MVVLEGCSGDISHQEEKESLGTASGKINDAEIDEQYGLEGGEDGSSRVITPLPAGRRLMTPEEWSWLTKSKEQYKIQPQGEARSEDQFARQTQEALAFAESNPDATDVGIMVMLEDIPFDYTKLNPRDGTESERDAIREARISERTTQLEASQSELEKAVVALGGKVTYRLWMGGNDIGVRVPARLIPSVSKLPRVRGVFLQKQGGAPQAAYTMGDARAATASRAQQFVTDGITGAAYGRSGGAIRMGIIEHGGLTSPSTDWPVTSHPGYKYATTAGSRVVRMKSCPGSTCTVVSPTTTAGHGHVVTSIAAGSILDGQDSSYTTSTDRGDRSGYAIKSEIHYYNILGYYDGLRLALQDAVSSGIDIANMSLGFDSGCNRALDIANINSALASALSSGIVLVGSAGNTATSLSDACSILYPMWRPEVISVNALDSSDDTVAYRDLNLPASTGGGGNAMGTMTIGVNGSLRTATCIGLSIPGDYLYVYGATGTPYIAAGGAATSWAAPGVAGSAGLFRSALGALGFSSVGNNANHMLALMLLMGDGWDGNTVSSPGTSVYQSTGLSRRSGAGRVRLRRPSGTDLVGPWYWLTRSGSITQGQTVVYEVGNSTAAEPSGITEFKLSLTWTDSDMDNMTDIDVSVWDMCPAGGGATQVQVQNDYDFHNRIRIASPNVSGKCLQIRVYGYHVPSSKTFYLTDMFYGGTPNP